MANHKTHQQGAILAGIIGSVAALALNMVNLQQGIIIFIAGYTGGMAPDLDHDQGKSLRFIFKLMTLIIPIAVIWKFPMLHSSMLTAVIYFAGFALLIYFPIRFIFRKLTVHRGIFHSIPAIIIYGSIFFLVVGKKQHDLPFQQAAGIVAGLGYFTHLALDEYSSLNFNGQRFKPKRSLGTALDFLKPNRSVTALAYLLMSYLLFMVFQQL